MIISRSLVMFTGFIIMFRETLEAAVRGEKKVAFRKVAV
jgi:hypothetical protein